MTFRLLVAYILAVIGIYLLAFENIEFKSSSFLGDFSAVISALFYAAYMLTGKKARLHFDNSSYAFVQYSFCALMFGSLGFILQRNFTGYGSISWVAIGGLILMPTLLGHLSLTYLVKFMDLSLLTCGKLIEPLIASIIAYFLFNELLKPEAAVAFSLTAASVMILFLPGLVNAARRRGKA